MNIRDVFTQVEADDCKGGKDDEVKNAGLEEQDIKEA